MKQIFVALLIGVGSIVWSQEQPLTADQIVQRFVDASGGSERLHSMRALRIRGTYEIAGNVDPFTLTRLSDDGYRIEVTRDEGQMVIATDCTDAWQQDPSGSAQLLDERSAALLIEEYCDLTGQLVDAENKGHRVGLIGKEDIDGIPAYHLQVLLKGGHSQDWFISAKTYLLIKKKVPGWSDWMGDHQVVIWYLDYQQYDGLMLPSLIERENNRTFVRSYSIEKVELNPKVDRLIFKAPEMAGE